jgi:hypothetical protein
LPGSKKITDMTKAPQGLSISEFSTAERAKLARLIEVCDAFLVVGSYKKAIYEFNFL